MTDVLDRYLLELRDRMAASAIWQSWTGTTGDAAAASATIFDHQAPENLPGGVDIVHAVIDWAPDVAIRSRDMADDLSMRGTLLIGFLAPAPIGQPDGTIHYQFLQNAIGLQRELIAGATDIFPAESGEIIEPVARTALEHRKTYGDWLTSVVSITIDEGN